MAKIALNKGSLQTARDELKLYQRLLPSLNLKRMQLTGEVQQAKEQLEKDRAEVERLAAKAAQQLPMLANLEIEVSGLVEVGEAELGEENVVGVKLPVLKKMECRVREYSLLATPHWVDVLVDLLKKMAEFRAKVQVAEERVRRMDQALRRINQRVNLFEKILIPDNKKAIQRIRIFLGDADRAAVVRSKIAKSRHVSQPEEEAGWLNQ